MTSILPSHKKTLVLSLELVKTYRVLFPLVDALRSFRVSQGEHVPPGTLFYTIILSRAAKPKNPNSSEPSSSTSEPWFIKSIVTICRLNFALFCFVLPYDYVVF